MPNFRSAIARQLLKGGDLSRKLTKQKGLETLSSLTQAEHLVWEAFSASSYVRPTSIGPLGGSTPSWPPGLYSRERLMVRLMTLSCLGLDPGNSIKLLLENHRLDDAWS